MFACRTTLEALQLALNLEEEFLYLEAMMLSLDPVWDKLGKTFFEEMCAELDKFSFCLKESMLEFGL